MTWKYEYANELRLHSLAPAQRSTQSTLL